MAPRLAAILFVAASWTGALGGERALVAVVLGENSIRAGSSEARGIRIYYDSVRLALDAAKVPHAPLRDRDVEAGRLRRFPVAIFPYSTVWTPKVLSAIEQHVAGGGKVICFYSVPDKLLDLLGIARVGYRQGKPRNQFATIRLASELIGGLPEEVRQDSWNITQVKPQSEDAMVVGEWYDPQGLPLEEPALIVSPRGAFMGHVLTAGDTLRKGQMLRAVIGHLVPAVWKQVTAEAIANAQSMGPLTSFDQLADRLAAADLSWWRRRVPRRHLRRARDLLATAEDLRAEARYPQAVEAAEKARLEAIEAYVRTARERRGELRGVWIHTAYGVRDWGWRRSIRHLRNCGFNAIFPNMLWAGLAHYPSKVLPVAPEVEEKGDQIAECLRWCRRYGVELHVWKVNFNLGRAPADFVERLRAERRLQRDRNGNEVLWLCPSDPRNFALERDSMLEVVRNYPVDGIHFDYIRYPGSHACFCEGCRRRFEEAAGVKVNKWPDDALKPPLKDRFMKWRQDQITRLVRAVATEARRIRPGVMVSAAVFNNWESHRFSVGQDWKLWIEEGLLDFVCPMDYTPDPDRLAEMVANQVEWVGGRVPLYPGIGAWRIPDVAGLVDQIERARSLGADGFLCFHYNDLEFALNRMPALERALTAHRTTPPHRAPRVEFSLPPGLKAFPGPTYREGSRLTFTAKLTTEGTYGRSIRSASGRLVIETTDGRQVRDLGRIWSDGAPVAAAAELPPGNYRLAVVGRARFGWFSSRAFVVRSRPFRVASARELQTERASRLPPVFKTSNLAVGVVSGGYGSEGILAALAEAQGVEALALNRLTEEFLRPCRVVVFPQPRQRGATSEDAVAALRQFVVRGGGLLATHDAPGYRGHPVLFPEVCKGGATRVEGSAWRVTATHPLTAGLPRGKPLPHSYYDAIALQPGPAGRVVAEALGKDGAPGGAAVVCGTVGKGRYAAIGLALGIDEADKEAEPQGAERRLLLNAVSWLGGL